ncbi:MAG: Nif3-like dinuclear metal center hexameric protein [Deltaproteobacteria bacterium]|jgi:dinuclear metal center YbgI/SA1388 family protein|nr:Nif3-like dinuclear metal center hexameric protein [Deltaproteobacteria bacterium]
MKVKDIVSMLDHIAPFSLAADWDNCGFQVGDSSAEIDSIALALDPTLENLKKARQSNHSLLITHHPLIFKSLKRLDSSNPNTAAVCWALSNGLSVISVHTNWDMAGVPQALAELIQLKQIGPLELCKQNFLKLVVFVPQSHLQILRKAIFSTGAGTIGEYKECYFQSAGQGGFTVPADGHPFSGTPGQAHQTDEVRLELILRPQLRDQVHRAVMSVHPYEKPAFEFYPIETVETGFGLIGRWDPPRPAKEFLAQALGRNGYWIGDAPNPASTVALMPGSGGSYVSDAKAAGAELLITGELSHHQALLALEIGLPTLAAGHFETERPSMFLLQKKLTEEIAAAGRQIRITVLDEHPPMTRIGDSPAGVPCEGKNP